MTESELLPQQELENCPFCGHTGLDIEDDCPQYYFTCVKCNVRVNFYTSGGINVAIKAWNTRTITRGRLEEAAKAIYESHDDDGWTWKTDVQANRDICIVEATAALKALGITVEG